MRATRHMDGKGSLTQSAYERLRRDLISGRIRPGERLKISDLCDTMSMNLSAVREALSRLSADGLVIAEPQRGFRSTPISATELRDLTRVRVEIENLCLRSAIARGDVAWEAGVVSAHHAMMRTPKFVADSNSELNPDWWPAHAAFHLALCAACDSTWLLRIRDMLYEQSERYRMLWVVSKRMARDIDGEHRDIAAAVLARDAETATKLMAGTYS